MSVQAEIDKADRAVKNAEIILRTNQTHLDTIDREIAQLTSIKNALQANIECLKKDKVIALAGEYKKAKEDLAKANNRLSILNHDRMNIYRAVSHNIKVWERAKFEFKQLLWSLENNVLRGKFGGGNDGQS